MSFAAHSSSTANKHQYFSLFVKEPRLHLSVVKQILLGVCLPDWLKWALTISYLLAVVDSNYVC